MLKTALLVVSFGTTHLDTLEKTIQAAENTLAAAFPEYTVYRAFTSDIVRQRLLNKYHIPVDSIAEAFTRISLDGFAAVIILPTLLIPGEEYDKLLASVSASAGTMQISVCKPLLCCEKDLDDMIEILCEAYPTADDTVLLLMGHGAEHAANDLYIRLAEKMRSYNNLRLCTIKGAPSFEDAIRELTQMPQRKVKVAPLMFVAGGHARKDMAGEGPGSLRSCLEKNGFSVECCMRGLGELHAVQEMFINTAKTPYAICQTTETDRS